VRELFPARWQAELKVITGSDTTVPTNYPNYIGLLNTAVSKVRQNLTPEEEIQVDDLKRHCQKMGNPPELQAKYV
jgi:hypothetical protein